MKDQTFNAILLTLAVLFALYTCNRGTEEAIKNSPNQPAATQVIDSYDSLSTTSVATLPDTLMSSDTTMAVNLIDSTSDAPDSSYNVSANDDILDSQKEVRLTYEQLQAELKAQQLLTQMSDMELRTQLYEQKRREDSANTAAMNRYYREDMERQVADEMQRRLNSLNSGSTYTTIPNFSSRTNPNVVTVDGYYRSNGTYVPSYHRTAPNNTIRDNFSTYPNYNPYTGKSGSRRN